MNQCFCGSTRNLTGTYYHVEGKGDVLIYECPWCLEAKKKGFSSVPAFLNNLFTRLINGDTIKRE